MAIVTTDDKHYKDIANILRSSLRDDTLKVRPEDMAGHIDLAVTDSFMQGHGQGFDDGYAQGSAEADHNYYVGYNDGKQAEYDHFWDALQSNGTRNYYDQAFAYYSGTWNDETFQPKYDILCEGSDAFRQTFSSQRNLTSTKVPIRCKNTRIVYTFQNCTALKTIPLLTLEGITQITQAFSNCIALENITIEGTIPLSISFRESGKLTAESVQSIIDHLKDLTGQTAQTLTFHADVGAKLTDTQKATITAKNWQLVY